MSAARPANSRLTYCDAGGRGDHLRRDIHRQQTRAAGGVPPLAYSFWQSFGAGVVLWVALTLKGERLGLTRQHLVGYIVIGALVIGIPITLLTYIAPRLPAGVLTLVLALSPPFTFVLSLLFRLERFRAMGLFGLLLRLSRAWCWWWRPGATLGSPDAWKWFLLALAAPLLFASSNVAAASFGRPPPRRPRWEPASSSARRWCCCRLCCSPGKDGCPTRSMKAPSAR